MFALSGVHHEILSCPSLFVLPLALYLHPALHHLLERLCSVWWEEEAELIVCPLHQRRGDEHENQNTTWCGGAAHRRVTRDFSMICHCSSFLESNLFSCHYSHISLGSSVRCSLDTFCLKWKIPAGTRSIMKTGAWIRTRPICSAVTSDTYEESFSIWDSSSQNISESVTGNSRFRCLPYFYIIGQPKCGTTDLFDRLRFHPDVRLALLKEPHWWSRKRFGVKSCSLKKSY